jgi:HAD superfamily hydrolase (TIGR01509 family)
MGRLPYGTGCAAFGAPPPLLDEAPALLPIPLILFDCDGVLVDSEVISCRVELAYLAALGHPITPDEFRRRAVGRSERDNQAMLEAIWGRALPADFNERNRAATLAAFETELQPVAGIGRLLERLGPIARCVASSSAPARIARSLELTGLARFFGGNLFSAAAVARGKPAPDLFLHAARRMGAEPAACLVVEDSAAGIAAAKAAGMTALGFTAGSHCAADHGANLRDAGADAVAADADALAALLADRSAA